jgi:hypothetical protein
MKRDNAEWLACLFAASLGVVYCIWVVPYIPTTDGPQHVLSAHIENHFSDPGSPYPDYYRILPQFAGKGFALLFGPLESLMPWRVALRVALSAMALTFGWGFALVVLAIDRTRRATSLLGFAVALPWSLYMGFFAFVIGTTLGLYTLAFVIHRPPNTAGRRAVVALLLLLQGVCHIFTAIVTGALLLVLAVAGAPRGQRLRETGRMALMGAPTVVLLGLTFAERNMQKSGQSGVDWELGARLGELSRYFAPGSGIRGWIVLALAVMGIATTLRRARQAPANVPALEVRLAWLGLACVALTLVAPIHIPGWQLLAPRFAVLATVLGFALLRVPEGLSAGAQRAAVPIVTAGCLASSLASASLHRQLASGCADSLAGLDAPLAYKGPRLPIILDGFCGAPADHAASPVPWAAMAFNVNLLYFLDHGGVAAKLFNGAPSIHALAFRGSLMPPPPDPFAQSIAGSHWLATDAKLRKAIVTELAANGMPFEGVHVVGGRPDDFEVFRERGYEAEVEHGSLFIARFVGCPSEILLPPGSLDHEAVFYEYGLFSPVGITPEPRTIRMKVVDPKTPVVNGAIRVPLEGRPCGELWVRVVWDTDGSSTFTPGDHVCAAAARDGRLLVNLTKERPTARCAAPPPAALAP